MVTAIIQRLSQMVFVLFGISALVFLIFFATPGSDPAARIAGRNATQETIAAIRVEFGFDRPLPVQYVTMMKRLFVTQDLASFVNRGMRVVPEVAAAAPVTSGRRLREGLGGTGGRLLHGGLLGPSSAGGRRILSRTGQSGRSGAAGPAGWGGRSP